MAITSGQLNANQFNTVNTATGSDSGTSLDQRRLYNFSDRIAELAPEESPFFVYLSKTAKLPTDDSIFRYLEDRSKVDYTSREFLIQGAVGTVAADTNYNFVVDTAGGDSVDWLIKGMVLAVRTTGSAAADVGFGQAIVRIETAPVDGGSDTSFTGRCLSVSGATGANSIADNDKCQVIGSAFAEGTGSPDVWSNTLDDGFGYTQIFKTAAEVTNTAYATRMRGYANEFERVLALKLREHKIDIERAMLFNHKARSNGINYTEGIVGQIIKNSTFATGTSDLSYTSGKAYARSMTQAQLTYDRLLSDLEVIFDPARGGSSEKLVMASLPVVTLFNKLGDGAFIDASAGYSNSPYRVQMDHSDGAFGHKVMAINTVHGDMYMVKQPLFRGHSAGLMLMADMSKLYYRPLVGNGVNRDTQVQTNVQAADEDLRKDMILTEAGLEVCLPEAHALYNVEGL
tara:strand:+ start:14825 stop:16195 length:1371 start_codon:yes stop_codon:yes gene_type:complete